MTRIMNRMQRDDERGFTLIELMVVVLIIAILIAIAIPTFLGARKRAQERAAQSSARNAFTAAKTIFTDTEDYTDVTQSKLEESEPSLTFVSKSTGSTEPNTVSWGPTQEDGSDDTAGNHFRVAVYSKSGICMHLMDVTGPITGADAGTEFGKEDVGTSTGNCTANRAESNFDTAFSSDGWTS